jgi:asparagine synthase (glutamine-hydrolysing)
LAAGVSRQVDEEMIDCYLGYQFCLGERTLFKGIKKLMAGHILRASEGKIEISQYWNIVPKPTTTTAGAAADRLRELLVRSSKYHMVSNVPMGAFLSGDIDSSTVVALTKPHVNEKFHTISAGFPNDSELKYAKIVSDHVGTTHHELIITSEMVAKQLEKIAGHYDEPVGDPFIVNNYFQSQEAGKYVKVVLGGEAGDELFAGNPDYAQNLRFEEMRHRLYGGFAKSLMGIYPTRGNIFHDPYEKGMSTFEAGGIEEMMLRSMRDLSDREIKWLRGKQPTNQESLAVMPRDIRYRLDRMLYIDCKNRLPEKYLTRADRSTMANSVEECLPFTDKAIVEFAFTLPIALKLNPDGDKFVLRLTVKDLLPAEIMKRERSKLATSADEWIRHEVGEMAMAELDSSEFLKDHFQSKRLERIGKELRSRGGKASQKIWTVYALGLWHRTYFGH